MQCMSTNKALNVVFLAAVVVVVVADVVVAVVFLLPVLKTLCNVCTCVFS